MPAHTNVIWLRMQTKGDEDTYPPGIVTSHQVNNQEAHTKKQMYCSVAVPGTFPVAPLLRMSC